MAIWVGYIAAFGMATETGIIMLVYLREAIDKRGGLENIKSLEELRQAVIEGAVHRLRPKLLTEGVAIVAIAPMLFATGVGSEIISAMALPVLGGLLIADEVVDIFLPVRFYWVRRARWLKLQEDRAPRQRVEDAATAHTADCRDERGGNDRDRRGDTRGMKSLRNVLHADLIDKPERTDPNGPPVRLRAKSAGTQQSA